jgi:cysteinyl-tRNA synthetase
MTLKLYDTYTRSLREFTPLNPPKVGLYTCGPTVYDYAHIGNLRTYIYWDILRRALTFNGWDVEHVMNITDVGHLTSDADTGEDKMELSARVKGLNAWELAEYYTREFKNNLHSLNILEPTIWSRATDHIQEQIEFIRCIEANGYTYLTSDGVYFDTSRLDDYGYLARLDIEGLQAGMRIEMGEKRSPTDFALWKFSPEGQTRQMEWDSPWGKGFPGWHIECSAMSAKYLGTFFDIHCGGEDHIPVHHPNEIAQTQACHGTNLANFWMHAYFLQLSEEKMAKSSGKFLRLQTLIESEVDPLAYRFFCMSAHYRTKLNFTWESLRGAEVSLDRLRRLAYEWGEPGNLDEVFADRFAAHINDDLNMPRAVAVVWDMVKSDLPPSQKKATLLFFDRILGLDLAVWAPQEEEIPQDILTLVDERQKARQEKNWQQADSLREKVIAAGYEIEDTPHGPKVKSSRTKGS